MSDTIYIELPNGVHPMLIDRTSIHSIHDSLIWPLTLSGPIKGSVNFFWNNRCVEEEWIKDHLVLIRIDSPLKIVTECRKRKAGEELPDLILKKRTIRWWETPDIPENEPEEKITLGCFVTRRSRNAFDFMEVDLSSFAPSLRTRRNQLLIAKLWKVVTDGDQDGDEKYLKECELNGLSRYFIARDVTFTKLQRRGMMDTTRNILQGETQIGKTEDLVCLAYFLPRLGFLTVVLVRNKGGDATLDSLNKGLNKIHATALKMMEEQGNEITMDDRRFFDTVNQKVFNKNYRQCYMSSYYTMGDLRDHALVIADRQNATSMKRLPNTIIACSTQTSLPIACLIDEDDESVNSYDGDSTQVEINRNAKNMHESLEDWDDKNVPNIPLNKILENTVFVRACKLLVSITATPFPLFHNSWGRDDPLITLKKILPDNYHGFDIPNPDFNIKIHTCEKPMKKSKRQPKPLFQRFQQPFDRMMDDAAVDYRNPAYPHVNVLFAGGEWNHIAPMKEIAKEVVLHYGNIHEFPPLIAFSYNSDRDCTMFLNSTENSPFYNKRRVFADVEDYLRDNFEQIKNIDSQKVNGIQQWKISLKGCNQRTTFLYYDIALAISEILQVTKPFIACVSGALAGRQATFKNSKHTLFLTHMYTYFSATTKLSRAVGSIVQRIGRICGTDDSVLPRKLYLDPDTKVLVEKAVSYNRLYTDFMVANSGRTINQITALAAENELPVYKEILKDSLVFHNRKKFSEPAREKIMEDLTDEYKYEIDEYELPQWAISEIEPFIPEIIGGNAQPQSQQPRTYFTYKERAVLYILWKYGLNGSMSAAEMVAKLEEEGLWHNLKLRPNTTIRINGHITNYRKQDANSKEGSLRQTFLQYGGNNYGDAPSKINGIIIETGAGTQQKRFRLSNELRAKADECFNPQQLLGKMVNQQRAVYKLLLDNPGTKFNGKKVIEKLQELNRFKFHNEPVIEDFTFRTKESNNAYDYNDRAGRTLNDLEKECHIIKGSDSLYYYL